MSDEMKSGEVFSEYGLIIQLSNELAQKTDEVLALEARNAELLALLEEAAAEQPVEELEDDMLTEAVPERGKWPSMPDSQRRIPKALLVAVAGIAIVAIGATSSVATFSLLYDMDPLASATALLEGVATLAS